MDKDEKAHSHNPKCRYTTYPHNFILSYVFSDTQSMWYACIFTLLNVWYECTAFCVLQMYTYTTHIMKCTIIIIHTYTSTILLYRYLYFSISTCQGLHSILNIHMYNK